MKKILLASMSEHELRLTMKHLKQAEPVIPNVDNFEKELANCKNHAATTNRYSNESPLH